MAFHTSFWPLQPLSMVILIHNLLCYFVCGPGTFDVVVVNLYPFYDKVTSSSEVPFEDGIENIDIGGPTMIRAAAKVFVLFPFSIAVIFGM